MLTEVYDNRFSFEVPTEDLPEYPDPYYGSGLSGKGWRFVLDNKGNQLYKSQWLPQANSQNESLSVWVNLVKIGTNLVGLPDLVLPQLDGLDLAHITIMNTAVVHSETSDLTLINYKTDSGKFGTRLSKIGSENLVVDIGGNTNSIEYNHLQNIFDFKNINKVNSYPLGNDKVILLVETDTARSLVEARFVPKEGFIIGYPTPNIGEIRSDGLSLTARANSGLMLASNPEGFLAPIMFRHYSGNEMLTQFGDLGNWAVLSEGDKPGELVVKFADPKAGSNSYLLNKGDTPDILVDYNVTSITSIASFEDTSSQTNLSVTYTNIRGQSMTMLANVDTRGNPQKIAYLDLPKDSTVQAISFNPSTDKFVCVLGPEPPLIVDAITVLNPKLDPVYTLIDKEGIGAK